MKKSIAIGLLCLIALLAKAADPTASVTLAWDKSPGTNVIINYKVYYGVASGVYTNSVSAGTNLTAVVTNLVRGKTYFFAATATDNNSLESDKSNQVSATTPTLPVPPQPPVALRIVTVE